MRLIDADALELILANAIEMMRTMAKALDCEDDPEIQMGIKADTDILNRVKEQQTIEPERPTELIHCKGCMYKEVHGTTLWCDHITGDPIMVKESDFCSWAEMEMHE